MRVLITGGCGFIGTHLCERLRRDGHTVRVLDIRSPEVPLEGVEYVRLDIREFDDVLGVISDVDVVYHFATVRKDLCQKKPLESYQTNVMGTLVVLESMRMSQRPIKLIFASTDAVYNDSGKSERPLLEEDAPLEPRSLYAHQKMTSEQMIRQYCESFGLSALCLRFFSVYGKGQNSGVLSKFACAFSQGRPISLHGGGVQTRDFVSVTDIVEACALAGDLDCAVCDGRAVNLGTGKSISIRALAEIMQKVFDAEVAVQETSSRQGDVLHSLSNPDLAKKLLGWSAKVSLEAGLEELHNLNLPQPKAA